MPSARTYFDPMLYIYSDSEWQNDEFIDRIGDLLQTIIGIKDLEKEYYPEKNLFDIRMSEELMNQLYSSNPIVNIPPKIFYFKQFTQSILPEILRRVAICPDNHCSDAQNAVAPAVANDIADRRSTAFADHINMCRLCSRCDPMVLVRSTQIESLHDPLSNFDRVISPGKSAPLSLVDPVTIAPFSPVRNRQEVLNLSIRSFAAVEAASDNQWGSDLSKMIVTDNFWNSIDRADFRHLDRKYKHRIMRSLTQIALSIDIDINAHGMNPQTFSYNNKKVNKWNAYVFQSGADAQDRRCSRIYYGFVDGGIVLHEYEQDAH